MNAHTPRDAEAIALQLSQRGAELHTPGWVSICGGDDLCPLHRAAPALYEELARVYTEEGAALRPETCSRVLALLAQVQGKSNG